MAGRGAARAAVSVTLAALLTMASGGPAAVAAPATQRDGAAAVIARYQARIPELMKSRHIPGLALVVVDLLRAGVRGLSPETDLRRRG